MSAALAAPIVLGATRGFAQTTSMKFALAAPFDGSNAAFFLGQAEGWYAEKGLEPEFNANGGSGSATGAVGSGVADMGIADINVMAEFNAKNPGTDIRNVYMMYYRSPLCVGSLAKSGITGPDMLAGRKFGAAAPDGAYRLFPAFTEAVGLDASTIEWDMVGLQLREAVLAKGQVEAILGFDSTMYFGLKKAGIDPDDIRFIYYSDVGLDLYGNGLMASKAFRTENPQAVKDFVEVSARAWQAAIADPATAIAALKEHEPLIDAALEQDKLQWLIDNQLVTEESKANGLGGIREDRLAETMAIVAANLEFPEVPTMADVYDPSFMPDAKWTALPV